MDTPISTMGYVNLALLAFEVCLALLVWKGVYNVFFHPLSKFPGPWYASVSTLWVVYHQIQGDHPRVLCALHDKYGDVVRVAPDELSYTHPQSVQDIYGHRKGGQPELAKHPSQNFNRDPSHPTILDADRERHSLLRRIISHAFSDKVMQEQEPVLIHYVDLLMQRLSGFADDSDTEVDLVEWFNFTTFDVIGHLTFAQPFDCLKEASYHPWASLVFNSIRHDALVRSCKRMLGSRLGLFIGGWIIPRHLKNGRKAHWGLTAERVKFRKANKPSYTDFMTHLLQAEEDGKLDEADILANAPFLVGAGSQTTATMLSGTAFLLLTNPRVYDKVIEEVRTTFKSSDEINLFAISKCVYLLAVLDESLRIYPPAAHNHPRVTPPEGAIIGGQVIPPRTMVGIHKYAAAHTRHNFDMPDTFVPERFTESEKWPNDRRDALVPFSFGPRNCIGRNLAYVEMRLVLCKLLWHYDMKLAPSVGDWLEQRAYAVWEKKPLMVCLKRRA